VSARRAAAALAAAALGLAACHPPPPRDPTAPAPGDAIFHIESSVPDAALWVDGRYIGTVGALRGGIALGAGVHRLEVRHDDYFSRYAELTVTARERKTLRFDLAPMLP
jgi:hypothetical protein